MQLEFVPFVGALPLKFGMTRIDIQTNLSKSPDAKRSSETRDVFDELGVNYDINGLAVEFCLFPNLVDLTFAGMKILGADAVPNPIPTLLQHDPEPMETVGFLVFLKLGVNLTGFHDNDESQLAFNVFQRGLWDEFISSANKVNITPLKKLGS